jgi:release factor glutamine methyltransferase
MPARTERTAVLQALYDNLKIRLAPVCATPEQASAEARLLLEEALEIDAQLLYSNPKKKFKPGPLARLEAMVTDRVERRMPVQYLVHRAWFYGLPLYINHNVLIPRPETEHLVEIALDTLKTLPLQDKPFRILDFGTGSGAIALALTKALGSQGEVFATDLSSHALDVAAINAKRLKLPVTFLLPGDGFSTLPAGDNHFDLIVSNPPYIDNTLKDTLAPEVLWHEPGMALFPPSEDAYLFYQRLAVESPLYLYKGGSLLVEVGQGQATTVAELFKKAGFKNPDIYCDYGGIERVVAAQLSNA